VNLEVALRGIILSTLITKSDYSGRVERYRINYFKEALLKLFSVAAKYLQEMNPLGEILNFFKKRRKKYWYMVLVCRNNHYV